MTELNRYGAQDNRNDAGELCCCHGRRLTATCDGCFALEGTKRQPTLAGVDPCRMNPLNDDGAGDALDAADTKTLEEDDDFAEDVDRLHPGVDRALEDADTIDDEELDSQDSPTEEGC